MELTNPFFEQSYTFLFNILSHFRCKQTSQVQNHSSRSENLIRGSTIPDFQSFTDNTWIKITRCCCRTIHARHIDRQGSVGYFGSFFLGKLKKNILLYTFLKIFLDPRMCFSIAEVPVLVLLRYENQKLVKNRVEVRRLALTQNTPPVGYSGSVDFQRMVHPLKLLNTYI